MELSKILEELEQYKGRDKNTIFAEYVQKRLNSSLKSYYNELDKTFSYLNTKNELKLLRKINKGKNIEEDNNELN